MHNNVIENEFYNTWDKEEVWTNNKTTITFKYRTEPYSPIYGAMYSYLVSVHSGPYYFEDGDSIQSSVPEYHIYNYCRDRFLSYINYEEEII